MTQETSAMLDALIVAIFIALLVMGIIILEKPEK